MKTVCIIVPVGNSRNTSEALSVHPLANEDEKEKYLIQFAEVLSKATYARKDVREFQ